MIPFKVLVVGGASVLGVGGAGSAVYLAVPGVGVQTSVREKLPLKQINRIESGQEVSYEFTSNKTTDPVVLKCASKNLEFPYLSVAMGPPQMKTATIKCEYKATKQVLADKEHLPVSAAYQESFPKCYLKDNNDEMKFFCQLDNEDLVIRMSQDGHRKPQLALEWKK
ncbi:hypothetical protein MHLP_01510 [Candidatus Mycoplasma haematolamae str. Purdue]|uniref:Uncharacterized protein n=1 Tax=Mycoplasma haematolamae (strain Purdue) TaxID=1212765 RepID=I7C5T9_MYCHA|nr:hypothetical protein [Candidatus Mycoplasma haematolamae]AFO51882.1 hypothetical protein MHLP_01510 [Candidatus Mycoplasma haematolamae str. Purdue]